MSTFKERLRNNYDRIALAMFFAAFGVYSLIYPSQSVLNALYAPVLEITLFAELIIGSAFVVWGLLAQIYALHMTGLTVILISFVTLFIIGVTVDTFSVEDFKTLILNAMVLAQIQGARIRYKTWLRDIKLKDTLIDAANRKLPLESLEELGDDRG